MRAMASQITSLTIVYSTVYSGADQRKHRSFASLAFVRGIYPSPVNSPHNGPVSRKMFPFDDVIMQRCAVLVICEANHRWTVDSLGLYEQTSARSGAKNDKFYCRKCVSKCRGWNIGHFVWTSLHWRHDGHGGVSNHQPHDYSLNHLFRRRSKKTSNLRPWPFKGNSFSAQWASNTENVPIWWRHHATLRSTRHLWGKPPLNGGFLGPLWANISGIWSKIR